MKNGKLKLLILFFVLILALWLRMKDFESLPRHGATFDEFAWPWLGINLIQKHEPISWSSQPQYKTREHLIYQGAAFWIVKPYLEHPPFFGMVAGSFALMNGVKDMYDVSLAKIRPLAIILGLFSVFMVFILGREIYDFETGILSAIIYATVPTLVIGSRIVQNENFLIPFWLFSIFLIIKYLKTGKRWLLFTAIIVSGLLSLAKVPWLVVGLSLSMILAYKGKWRDAFLTFGATGIIFSLFIFYGFYFDKDLFINLWRLQLARYDISFAGFYSLFTSPLLVDRYYLDGWIFFGWISIFLAASDFKKNFFILIPFLAYLIIYVFAIPNEPSHGWYRYPFYPFLIISIAVFIKEHFSKNHLLTFLFFIIVGLSLLQLSWGETFGFSFLIFRSSIFIFALTIINIFLKSKKLQKGTNIINIALFIFFIFLNIWAIGVYKE